MTTKSIFEPCGWSAPHAPPSKSDLLGLAIGLLLAVLVYCAVVAASR